MRLWEKNAYVRFEPRPADGTQQAADHIDGPRTPEHGHTHRKTDPEIPSGRYNVHPLTSNASQLKIHTVYLTPVLAQQLHAGLERDVRAPAVNNTWGGSWVGHTRVGRHRDQISLHEAILLCRNIIDVSNALWQRMGASDKAVKKVSRLKNSNATQSVFTYVLP